MKFLLICLSVFISLISTSLYAKPPKDRPIKKMEVYCYSRAYPGDVTVGGQKLTWKKSNKYPDYNYRAAQVFHAKDVTSFQLNYNQGLVLFNPSSMLKMDIQVGKGDIPYLNLWQGGPVKIEVAGTPLVNLATENILIAQSDNELRVENYSLAKNTIGTFVGHVDLLPREGGWDWEWYTAAEFTFKNTISGTGADCSTYFWSK